MSDMKRTLEEDFTRIWPGQRGECYENGGNMFLVCSQGNLEGAVFSVTETSDDFNRFCYNLVAFISPRKPTTGKTDPDVTRSLRR